MKRETINRINRLLIIAASGAICIGATACATVRLNSPDQPDRVTVTFDKTLDNR